MDGGGGGYKVVGGRVESEWRMGGWRGWIYKPAGAGLWVDTLDVVS